MFILTVIPLARGVFAEELTYFTVEHVPVGALISVPLRGRTIYALVIREEAARDQKALLKQQSFVVKQITEYKTRYLLDPRFIDACLRTAQYFVQQMHHVLAAQIPKLFLTHAIEGRPQSELATPESEAVAGYIFVLQESALQRMTLIKRQIRERFARHQSVFLMLPTLTDIEAAAPELERGIEGYTYTFHSSMSKTAFSRQLKAVTTATHPLLIIGTSQFLVMPIPQLGCVIVEHENSLAYKTSNRPFFDQRLFVKFYAAAYGIDLVYADALLSTETMHAYGEKEYTALSPLLFRPLTEARVRVIDMRPNKKDLVPKTSFRIFSDELSQALATTLAEHSRIFLFAHRKGLAPMTVCQDCETIVACARCEAPLTLYTARDGKQAFRCSSCQAKSSTEDKCRTCGGWRLRMLGIGIEHVVHELETGYPRLTLFRLDADVVRSHESARQIMKSFLETPHAVLLGTEMAFYYLHTVLPRTAVISCDALFALPNFRIREKIMQLLFRLRELSAQDCLVQTRKPDDDVFTFFKDGDLQSWYKQELLERKTFHYPPYTVLVKVSCENKEAAADELLKSLAERYKDFSPLLYKAKPQGSGILRHHILLRLPKAAWPEASIIEDLRALPPHFSVQVDPESLF